jgi:hypothetical protein
MALEGGVKVNMWIVAINRTDGNEDSIYFETHLTKQKAIEAYEELKEDIKEQCDDIGFSGDEGVYIAKVTEALLPVTKTDEKEAFWFEWEEFKEVKSMPRGTFHIEPTPYYGTGVPYPDNETYTTNNTKEGADD